MRFWACLRGDMRSRGRTAATRCAEVPVRLRTGRATPKWLVRALPADYGAGAHDATPQENSGQVSKSPGPRSPSLPAGTVGVVAVTVEVLRRVERLVSRVRPRAPRRSHRVGCHASAPPGNLPSSWGDPISVAQFEALLAATATATRQVDGERALRDQVRRLTRITEPPQRTQKDLTLGTRVGERVVGHL